MKLVEQRHLDCFHKYVYECVDLKIKSDRNIVILESETGKQVRGVGEGLYLQMGDKSVCIQWKEYDGVFRHWVRVEGKIEVDRHFKMPEDGLCRSSLTKTAFSGSKPYDCDREKQHHDR